MTDTRAAKLTGLLLILTAVAFNAFFLTLQLTFSYPDILREPTDIVLRRFQEGGRPLIATWYGFAMTAALFLPAALLLQRALGRDLPSLALATPFAAIAALVQLLGLIRWPLLVPILADGYFDPAATPASREAYAVVFRAFHQYAGVALGEHLGYLFTGLWTIVIGLAMRRSARFPAWLGVLGVVSALGILAGMAEPAGVGAAGLVNALSYLLWSGWLILSGVLLLRARPERAARPEASAAPASTARAARA